MDTELITLIHRLNATLGLEAQVRVYDLYAVATYVSPTQEPLVTATFKKAHGEWVYHSTSSALSVK